MLTDMTCSQTAYDHRHVTMNEKVQILPVRFHRGGCCDRGQDVQDTGPSDITMPVSACPRAAAWMMDEYSHMLTALSAFSPSTVQPVL